MGRSPVGKEFLYFSSHRSLFGTVLTLVPKVFAQKAVLARPPPRIVSIIRGVAPTI